MSPDALTDPEERQIPEGFSRAGLTFVLAALTWIGPFSIDAYLPSLPAIAESLHVSVAQVQQTMTAFLFVFAVMSLWHGAISDTYGRRRLTLISLVCFLLASLGCAMADNINLLMFFRAMQGATAGTGMIVGRAIVRDLFDGAEAQRLMARVAAIFSIAPILAPVLGGWFQVWFGWRSIFVFMALLSGTLFLSCRHMLPETLSYENRQRLEPIFLARSYWKVLTNRPFLMACGSMALTNAGLFIYILGAPVFLMKHLHLRETQFVFLFLPISIALIAGSWMSSRFAGRISGRHTIFIGYAIAAFAAIGNFFLNLLVPPTLPWAIVPIFVYVMGMSLAMPSLTLITLDLFPSQRGLASSCQGFISLAFNSVVSAFVALTWGTTLSLAMTMLLMLGVGVAMICTYFRLIRHP
jgi:DHA1 family bicyclomycin/chloramphenicol resistance-like MFS transporter